MVSLVVSSEILQKFFRGPNVRVQANLIKNQQEHDKDLREHVKLFREENKDQEIKIKIKGGKVVKNEQGKQDIVLYDPRKEIKD